MIVTYIFLLTDGNRRCRFEKEYQSICRYRRFAEAVLLPRGLESAEALTEGDYTYTVTSGAASITAYSGTDTGVTIPSELGGYPVTKIAANAFSDKTSLESVVIPDSVTSIGNYAFSGCSSLASVSVPGSVKAVPGRAFLNCTNLSAVTLGSGVESIEEYAFEKCTFLTSFVIPDSVTSISYRAFFNCSSHSSVTLSKNWSSVYMPVSYSIF